MASPITFRIPHSLGKAEAKRRMAAGISQVADKIPGGGDVQSSWPSEDHLNLAITAMGQDIGVDLMAGEDFVEANIALPFMLAMMSGPITDMVRSSAEKMLESPAKG